MIHGRVGRATIRLGTQFAVAGAALCLLLARPAFADPALPAVPDEGARPAVAGSVQIPGATAPGGPTSTIPATIQPGPFGQRILTESAAIEALGQSVLKLEADLRDAQEAAKSAQTALTDATDALSDVRNRMGHEAGEAYKAAAAMGPLGQYASDLHQLSVLAPGLGQQPGGQATARDLERAEQTENAAHAALDAATAKVAALTQQHTQFKTERDRRDAALAALKKQNAIEYQRELAAIDAQQANLGRDIPVGTEVGGMAPNPKALQALVNANSKLGAPYVWGAAGPFTFDCSGLVLWSYRSAGVNVLPRVANDQYAATSSRRVRPQQLLKGDLLFFATNKSDWRTIHHVAIYAGDGYMIHAPTTGDVVRISPIWWAEFFDATRVLDAVPAPAPGPTTAPPPNNPPPTNPTKQPTSPPTTQPTTPPSTKPPVEPTRTAAPSGSSSTKPSSPTGGPSDGKSASSPASSKSASKSASSSASSKSASKSASASP
jgi:cell wall-associated NlpC family hydrolase